MQQDNMEVDDYDLQPATDPLDAYLISEESQACPAGYQREGDVLVHMQTGVRCLKRAIAFKGLRGRTPWRYGNMVVLYHYCPGSNFEAIVTSDKLNCSTNLTTDCDFGIGQYATKKPPHAFADIWAILRNNYPRATAGKNPGNPGFPAEERARFCIPLMADEAWTPAFPLTDPDGQRGAVRESSDRYGPFDPLRHDIWIVSAVFADPAFADGPEQNIVALHKAAETGNGDIVLRSITNGVLVDARDAHGRAPLRRAAIRGHAHVVQLLLSQGANPSLSDHRGETALHDAVSEGHVDVVAVLLSAGAPITSRGRHGETPFCLASKRVHQYGTTGKDKVSIDCYVRILEMFESMFERLLQT